ncbi:hypothetical protein T484DRAFT_1776106 [Baffinella frigidus]|nr:hypothetical protein T484DRAFT_1776106 [Cryptophyta sp. CCMP2293]
MQTGLFGISELQGGKGRSDYLARSVSPACVLATPQGRRGVTLDEVGTAEASSLVDTLSRPELVHICAKWGIQDKQDIPLGSGVPRQTLVHLIVHHAGALGELLKVRTPQSATRLPGIQGGASLKPAVRLNAPRGTTAGCTTAMRDYEQRRVQEGLYNTRMMEARTQSKLSSQPPATGSPNPALKKRHAGPGATMTLSTVGHLEDSGVSHFPSSGADSKNMSTKDRYRSLKRELEATRRSREIVGLELARRGLLATVLETGLFSPVYRGQCYEIQNVKRNAEATSSLLHKTINPLVQVVDLRGPLTRVGHQVSLSHMHLCF